MRLIDADALIPKGTKVTDEVIAVYNAITAAPTIDAVPVVRCKDCRHFVRQENGRFCTVFSGYYLNVRFDDDFCSYGER